MPRQLTFAEGDPVTGSHPTLDGFTGLHEAYLDGVNTAENDEPGYTLGGRVTFDGGSGLSPAVIQAVKGNNEDFLYLSFLIRQDQSFDIHDLVMLSVRPDVAGTHDANTCRFDIFPVYTAATKGADSPSADPLLGNGDPDDTPLGRPGIPTPPSDYHIRTNKPARAIRFFRGLDAAGPPYWAEPTNVLPTGMAVKVRSWAPIVPSGSAPDRCWSIEVKLPISLQLGTEGDELREVITLGTQFGVYVNLVRISVGGTSPPVSGYQANTQYIFPDASATVSGTLGVNTLIDPTKYGEGYIPSLDSPAGAHTAKGVRFRRDVYGTPLVGVRKSSDPAGTAPGGQVHNKASGIDNVLVAQVENTGTTDPDDAPNVTADFHFANWGLGPGSTPGVDAFPDWAPASGAAPMPTLPKDVDHGTQVELTTNWLAANVPTDYNPPHDHQCVFVMLDSSSGVDFVEDSVRRNMDFVAFSEQERNAEISGVGYPPPVSGNHKFALVVNSRQMWVPGPPSGGGSTTHLPPPTLVPVWQWIVSGFRKLDETLTIDGEKYETWHPAPGAFGYIGTHDDPSHELTYQLTGGGLNKLVDGVYELEVPHNGSVTIGTRVAVGPKKGKRKGCLATLIAILLAIIAAIKKLFKK
jgi:hypothetical protein